MANTQNEHADRRLAPVAGYVGELPPTLKDIQAWHDAAANWHAKTAALIRRWTPDAVDDINPHEAHAKLHRAFADALLSHTAEAVATASKTHPQP